MNLEEHYSHMRNTAFSQWHQGNADIDALVDSPHDTRRGVSLITKPPTSITAGIEAILADFKQAEPAQYYYPTSEIHITILSIISCYSGFSLSHISVPEYDRVVRAILPHIRPFFITISGLTASAGGIMVQGMPHGSEIQELRNKTRQYFQQSGLQQSIDQRYRLQTAHSTIMRFRTPLLDTEVLMELVLNYQHQFIGTFEVNTLELVLNDWYHRAQNTTVLARYRLETSTGQVA